MGSLVKPKVFLVGYSALHTEGLLDYLTHTKQMDFYESVLAAKQEGISDAEIMCSMYAKLCYKSLTLGKNANITRTRDIRSNLEGCHDTGHGSVFEHVNLNFIVTDCSRVYTHEQVRHRQGWAYSQTSGRYCRLDKIDLVWSSLLDSAKDLWMEHLGKTEDLVYLTECKLGLRKPPGGMSADAVPANLTLQVEPFGDYVDEFDPPLHFHVLCEDPLFRAALTPEYQALAAKVDLAADQDGWATPENTDLDQEIRAAFRWVPDNSFNFDKRKAITSAIRRIAPNGQANEIGMSVNIRALRHTVQLRTQRFAETEIRDIFGQIYNLTKARFPTIFYKAKERIVDDLLEVHGMRLQPYEIEAGDPKALQFWDSASLAAELTRRETGAK